MRLNKVIISAFILMIIGTVLELYLIDHYESVQQLIPILCIGCIVLTVIVLVFIKAKWLQNIYKLLLVVSALSGFYGAFLHLNANFEFEQEMKPTAGSWDLFSESLSGALPALAPLSMVVLALIGYSYLIIINQKQ